MEIEPAGIRLRLPGVWLLLAPAISAGLFLVSIGLGETWPAAWLAPLPVLLLAYRVSARRAAACACAAFFLGSLNQFPVLSAVMPAGVVFVILLLPALVFALAVVAARAADRLLAPVVAAFAFPALWTSYEFLLSLASPHGTASSIAYSQTDFLPLLQVVSITGIWGVTFLLTLVPSAVAAGWQHRSLRPLAAPAAVALLVLGFGVFRLRQPAGGSPVPVGLAATDRGVMEAFATRDPTRSLAVAEAYALRAARLARLGARVVVLPEKFVGVTPANLGTVQGVLGEAARRANITLVAGLNLVGANPPRNLAVVFAPDGTPIVEYDKRHMLPGPESGYLAGAAPGLFSLDGVPWGVAICKDMDFPSWPRGYAARGVRIVAVPAWDFVRDGRLHSRMAVTRAVEDGFTLLRTAQQGLLTVSDPWGRVVAERSSGSAPEVLLSAAATPGPGHTLYTRFGDWFGWCCLAGLGGLAWAAAGGTRLPKNPPLRYSGNSKTL